MLLLLLACTGPAADTALPVDTAPPDDTAVPAAPPDPSSFDCSAAAIPERVTPIPWACATDVACTERLVAGHRGMGGEQGVIAPENTLSAIRAAIAYGVDFVETDPRPTADGVIINLHDTSLARTTDGAGDADLLTYDEIRAFHILSDRHTGDFACEYVPTLQEVLLTARGRVHVLVDANKTDRVDLLVAAIQETDTLAEAIFDTSSPEKIAEALALEPALHTMIRVESEEELDSELAGFAAHPPVIVEIPDTEPELATAVRAAGNRAFIDVFFTDAAVVYQEDPSLYGAFYEQGLAIVQSDRPELVLGWLGR
ncbi:MAG: glycerophosphodiester phosphodiesterase family protein [Pseudomonadota bacterium]|nr:glycerophosphodiester phosphodiesterase family protein [Pseudomonadota bacterium]